MEIAGDSGSRDDGSGDGQHSDSWGPPRLHCTSPHSSTSFAGTLFFSARNFLLVSYPFSQPASCLSWAVCEFSHSFFSCFSLFFAEVLALGRAIIQFVEYGVRTT